MIDAPFLLAALVLALAFPPAEARRVVVAPRESLAVDITGAGAPVVIVPGLLGSAATYRLLTRSLADAGYRVFVIEPLAFGTSSRPAHADYSLLAQAGRIARAMDALGVSGAVVVGHSAGGAIALRVAYARPDLVTALVLLEAGPAESAATPGFRRAMGYAPLIRLGGMRVVRRYLRGGLRSASGDAAWVTDSVVRAYTAGTDGDLSATLRAWIGMANAVEREPLRPHLARVRCPVRQLLGAAPHDGGPGAVELAALTNSLPSYSVVRVEGAGHFLHEERPDAVLAQVLAALRGRSR